MTKLTKFRPSVITNMPRLLPDKEIFLPDNEQCLELLVLLKVGILKKNNK